MFGWCEACQSDPCLWRNTVKRTNSSIKSDNTDKKTEKNGRSTALPTRRFNKPASIVSRKDSLKTGGQKTKNVNLPVALPRKTDDKSFFEKGNEKLDKASNRVGVSKSLLGLVDALSDENINKTKATARGTALAGSIIKSTKNIKHGGKLQFLGKTIEFIQAARNMSWSDINVKNGFKVAKGALDIAASVFPVANIFNNGRKLLTRDWKLHDLPGIAASTALSVAGLVAPAGALGIKATLKAVELFSDVKDVAVAAVKKVFPKVVKKISSFVSWCKSWW